MTQPGPRPIGPPSTCCRTPPHSYAMRVRLTARDMVAFVSSLALLIASYLPAVRGSVDAGNGSTVALDVWHSYGNAVMIVAFAAIVLWAAARLAIVRLPPDYNWSFVPGTAILCGVVLAFVRAAVDISELHPVADNVRIAYGAFVVLALGTVTATAVAWRPWSPSN
jgi:hypothetical protein